MNNNSTLRIGSGLRVAPRPLRSRVTSKLGLLVDRITSFVWGLLALAIPLAPYLALKPATNFWWWP